MINEDARIGDLVVRAYAWPVFDIGVIIGITPHCEEELQEHERVGNDALGAQQTNQIYALIVMKRILKALASKL